jgi:hypothetical protein
MDNKRTYAEEIIKKKREAENEKSEDIYSMENHIKNGFVVVDYNRMNVKERLLLDGSISMCIPEEFEIMNQEQVQIKYPAEDRPQYVYTNDDTTVNLTFSIEEGEIGNEEIEEVRNLLSKQMQKLYPASKIEDLEVLEVQDKIIGCFSFEVPLVDGDVYNFMFFMALKNGLLMGTFNCSVFDKKQWSPILKQMLMTVKENENECKAPIEIQKTGG